MKKYQIEKYVLQPKSKLAKRMIYQDDKVIAFVLNIAAGEELPTHTHFDCTVLVNVLAGKGDLRANEQVCAIAAGDLIEVDGQEKMSIQNTGDQTLSLYITISPAPPSDKYSVDVDI